MKRAIRGLSVLLSVILALSIVSLYSDALVSGNPKLAYGNGVSAQEEGSANNGADHAEDEDRGDSSSTSSTENEGSQPPPPPDDSASDTSGNSGAGTEKNTGSSSADGAEAEDTDGESELASLNERRSVEGESDSEDTESKSSSAEEALIEKIDSIPGLTAKKDSRNVIRVTGSASITTNSAAITLDIDPDITVHWNAGLSGSIGAATNYLLTLSGGGAFIIGGCTVTNTGTAGVIRISGEGARLTTTAGATVFSGGSSGNAISIAAGQVTVNVDPGSLIESGPTNGNAAMQVSAGLQGVAINVNGGFVVSDQNGYAIGEGSGTTAVSNNTNITINSGEVYSKTCAIHSTGTASSVTVNGGSVTSNGVSSGYATIYMYNGTGDNVIINGGTIQNLEHNTNSYSVMTTGNVIMRAGFVLTDNGRGINLIGTNSVATIYDGLVQAVGEQGVAISTGTTSGIATNASVRIEGGTIKAESGKAIRIAGPTCSVVVKGGTVSSVSGEAIEAIGADASVTVSGGSIFSSRGNAINMATGATARSAVTIDGGLVWSESGNAIYSYGTNSAVVITDSGNGGSSAQVWVKAAGPAISSRGAVKVTGGLVFAFGTDPSSAITYRAGQFEGPVSGNGGIVAVWDNTPGRLIYVEGSTIDLSAAPGGPGNAGVGDPDVAMWLASKAAGDGFAYKNGATQGFFSLSNEGVTVRRDFGLIFDSSTGNMYSNVDETGTLSQTNLANPYFDGKGLSWAGSPGLLELYDFSWAAPVAVALSIVGEDTDIVVNGTNIISSTAASSGDSIGISATGLALIVTGTGALEASGTAPTASGLSFGIRCESLFTNSATLVIRGETAACDTIDFHFYSLVYTYHANTDNVQPDGPGTLYGFAAPAPYHTPYVFDPDHKYIMLSVDTLNPLALVGNVTVLGTMGEALVSQTAMLKLYHVEVLDKLYEADVSHWFKDLPIDVTVTAMAEAGSTDILLTFSGIPAEGFSSPFDITIPVSALTCVTDLNVRLNLDALFDIARTNTSDKDGGGPGEGDGSGGNDSSGGDDGSSGSGSNNDSGSDNGSGDGSNNGGGSQNENANTGSKGSNNKTGGSTSWELADNKTLEPENSTGPGFPQTGDKNLAGLMIAGLALLAAGVCMLIMLIWRRRRRS